MMEATFRIGKVPVDGDHKHPRSAIQAAEQKRSREQRFASTCWAGSFLRDAAGLEAAGDSSHVAQNAN